MIRSPEALAQIRQQRAQAQQQAQQAQIAEQLSKGAKNLAQADVGGGQNILAAMTGVANEIHDHRQPRPSLSHRRSVDSEGNRLKT